jgi:hypothetical protein
MLRGLVLPVGVLVFAPEFGFVLFQLSAKVIHAQINGFLVGTGAILGREALLVHVDIDLGRFLGRGRVVLSENDVRTRDAVVELFELPGAVLGVLAYPIANVYVAGRDLGLKSHKQVRIE